MFARTRVLLQQFRRHNRVTALGAVVVLLGFAASGCLADPRRLQSADLLDHLGSARTLLMQQPPSVQDGCNVVGDVQTRLYGEPGLVDVQPAWSELRGAADALQAVCGESTLLQLPSTGSVAIEAAQTRWQAGVQREIGVACDHLRAAASALGRSAPC